MQCQVGSNQRGINIELLGEHSPPQQLRVETLKDLREAISADAFDKDRDGGVVKYLVIYP